MYHWAIVDCTYLYDGSMEGLLTVAYQCFKDKQVPKNIVTIDTYVGNLFDEPITFTTNLNKATQLLEEIERKTSDLTMYYIYTAYLSSNPHKANAIVRYLVYAFKYGKNINYMKSLESVIEIRDLYRSVMGEAHRFYGFLRFRELSNTFLYAEYESDHDILQYLGNHFSKRLKQEIWMIHDKKRSQVALYNRKEFVIVDATTLDISSLETSEEDKYLVLWKDYFKNISIKERENKRCQMNFMPKKYWKHMPEV